MDLAGALGEALRVGIGPQAAAYAVAAIGLNLHFGYTGLLNFGHVGFFLVGAYGAAITVDAGGSLWLGIGVGLLASVALALVLGVPTLRLRADYLAIVTIAVAEILRLVVRANAARPLTGGVFGIRAVAGSFYDLNPIPPGTYGALGLVFSHRSLWVIIAGWTLAGACTVVVWALVRSPWGRVLRAIREDEDAARSLGKNVFAYKLQSLVLGGALGALAGILLMINQQSVVPDTYLAVLTFYTYTVLILGGTGTTWGPIVGSIVFWFLTQLTESLLRQAVQSGSLGGLFDVQDLAALRFALVGLGLILLMVFRPQGIFGRRAELQLDAT
ncbi:MAG TPA: branched-chain amino acid ABC transporter permease [Acidimicrobiales bacterium]|jgi:neutral amino acid transport system permease protein|nr:branched-chain amino acid ABC transporter permease [Acidimicrobiales bacterium]